MCIARVFFLSSQVTGVTMPLSKAVKPVEFIDITPVSLSFLIHVLVFVCVLRGIPFSVVVGVVARLI